MKNLRVLHVLITPRAYELGSVLLCSGGINILTGTIGNQGSQEIEAGLLMTVAGVLSWSIGGMVSRYWESGRSTWAILKNRALLETSIRNPSASVPNLPPLTTLILSEANAESKGRLAFESGMFAVLFGLVFMSFWLLISYAAQKKTNGAETTEGVMRSPQSSKQRMSTFSYRGEPTNGLSVDVHYMDNDHSSGFPIVVFLHGGGLMLGDKAIDANTTSLSSFLITNGFTFVSIDYRLAPTYRLQDAAQDTEDACNWVRQKAGRLFPGDSSRLIIMGESAGAYLSLLAGQRLNPAPKCLVSLWGYGDITGDWYTLPSQYFLKWPRVSREVAFANKGLDLYLHARQTGTWIEIVTGIDPKKQRAELLPYCPRFNITKAYPPTLFVGGTDDQDVPFDESVSMADALQKAGVRYEFVQVAKGGHGFEETDPKNKQIINERVLAFLRESCK